MTPPPVENALTNQQHAISAVVVARNEEDNIAACLASITWCDEIILIDMESDDHTTRIARRYTNKIYSHKKVGYADPARNFAVSKATGPWILVLDADERISAQLKTRLLLEAQKSEVDIIELPRKNIIFGRWIRHTQWWPDYAPRFFKKESVTYTKQVHAFEKKHSAAKKIEAAEELAIIHYNYKNMGTFMEKMNRYTSIEARCLAENKVVFTISAIVSKPTKEFIWRYIIGKGFLDGWRGFVLSVLMAYYWFVVYKKLWQLERQA